MIRRVVVAAVCLLSVVCASRADADQSLFVTPTLAACSAAPTTGGPPSAAALTALSNANRSQWPGVEPPSARVPWLVHVTEYNANASVREQGWYVFDGRSVKDDGRLYGVTRVSVVAIQIGVMALPKARAAVDTTKGLVSPAGDAVSVVGAWLVDDRFSPALSLGYRLEIARKDPAPLEHLNQLLQVFGTESLAAKTIVPLESVTLCGAVAVDIPTVPSSIKAMAVVRSDDKDKEIGSASLVNERKYPIDFAFALPMTSYRDVTITADAASLTAHDVKKASLFAVVRLTNPVDLQRPGIHGGVIYGMPISGRAIHHHLVAAEVGWRGFSVFAGTIFNRDDTGASTAWTHDGTWGLMFSSQAIVNLFAKSKK